ncbi:hypothetical protein CYY_001233 [Polysphondylium violaceum]|uniref:Uncharacterized protein n=1 Tax=Polysphondylium violaceum TaxID=133409 RepID=A0A8J4V1T2_9MYCE|nr:hypothetical protein CYY_001233 [Polysphondylium violaceum]
MNKFITLFVILFCVAITKASIDTTTTVVGDSGNESYGIGIWNNGTSVNIGLVGYYFSTSAIQQLVIPNSYLPVNNYQPSTYNYATKVLTLVVADTSYNILVIYFIDCGAWKVISEAPAPSVIVGGLASTQSSNNIVMASYLLNNPVYQGSFFNTFIYPNGQITSAGLVQGAYRGSVFSPLSQNYYLAFKNQTGLFIKSYDLNFHQTGEQRFSFANNQYPVLDLPMSMSFNPYNQGIMVNVAMTDSSNNLVYAIGYIDWNSRSIVCSNMLGYSTEQFLATAPLLNTAYAYTAAYENGVYSLYQWNTYASTFMTYRHYYTPLLSIF